MTPVYEFENGELDVCSTNYPLRLIYSIEPFVAALALIAILPLAALIALVITLLSGRSPLIRHVRAGWRGSTLPMLKFRTMWDPNGRCSWNKLVENVQDTIPVSKKDSDPRVSSKFALFCRRYSLDEIPQLYHVARGEMSFVGPRPITCDELTAHYGASGGALLSVRPGMTGLWQVLGRSRLTYARRRRLDLLFVRRASPSLYLWILLRTVPRVIRGYDAC
jgi:lipopolysaccharide/colanic/teichoic acid biosynthesis glycosyltransferase